MDIFPFVLYSVFGLCIGSFLNVVIYRLPIGMPIAKGRSMCPGCEHQLAARDLIPLFSFLFLKGKCRYCKAPISWRYPGIEALTGVLFGLCAMVYGITAYASIMCIFCSCLIVAWFIDLDHTIIPDSVHVVLLALAAVSWFTGPVITLQERLAGAAIGVGMFLLSWATSGGIGGGDIKLMTVCGLLLGWKLTLPAFFLAYILAAIRWAPAFIMKKAAAGTEVPMGGFFSVALIIMALFGRQLIAAYLNLF